ncbi:hypothetical protein N7532_004279 [Penicillium argentinense]|uniref:Uncharacterized protein n=1 Tax=Penicillium argentinense TaxID=1131581 RepID=A0A9W9FP32_9EURO|nr:uncharacterized protein N7532_004279 [Penicillium argentinense]KAJ5103750.1 hypothetical protein N7532_004279 [Penicillium argentinense]
MVLLIATNRILTALEAVPASRREELELPATLELHGPIAHEQLLRLSKHLNQDTYKALNDDSNAQIPTVLSALLRGTAVYVPPPPKKPEPVRPNHLSNSQNSVANAPQSPEYLASKARLLAAAQQAEYQRLLNPTYIPNADHADPHSADNAPVLSEDPLTPSLVLNIFLSVIITGFSVYWALTKFTMPEILATIFSQWTGPAVDEERKPAGASDAVRVLLSLFAALAVAVAESFLYVFYIGKIERAKIKEGKLKERKVFVKEVYGALRGEIDEGRAINVDEKAEIWGKGVNGGVRRRIREKWEKENEAQSET